MALLIQESIKFIKLHLHDILLMSLGILIFVILKTKHLINIGHDNVNVGGKTIKREIIIENMDVKEKEKEKEHNKIVGNMTADFCKTLQGKSHEIEKECEKQTDGACKVRSCCVLTKKKGDTNVKCLAGSKVGPTYHTDDNGNDINFDYYYYQNKCYGTGCPKQ